ncbi:MAG: chloride channel protein, partial [Ilumatobacter sp.]
RWLSADQPNVPETSGFHAAPPRPRWLTVVMFFVVVSVSVSVAHLFRDTAEIAVEWWSSEPDVVAAAAAVKWLVLFGVVSVSVFVAACLGRRVETRRALQTGIEAVAASARGEPRRISFRASGTRAVGTWVASTGLSSIGRESAIIEIGGAFGTLAGRRSGGRGDALATAGIAAAFAAAYFAPLAAILYLEEHLRVLHSRRALWFAMSGAVVGHIVSWRVMGGRAVFPAPVGSRWRTLLLSILVLVPVVVGARLFRVVRVRVRVVKPAERIRVPWWSAVAVFSLAAGAAVATFPFAAGNGMEALRNASVGATLTIAVALSIGKLIGTAASLGAGAPGGALTPSMSIASGTGLLCLLALEHLGVEIHGGVTWGVMVAAMAVGVTVGLRSPLMAIVLVPELVGDYTMLPVIAVVVAAAVLVDRGVDRATKRTARVPDVIYDEDA